MSVAATLPMSSPRGMSVLKHSSSGARPGCLLANEGLAASVTSVNGVFSVNMPDQ